MDVTLIINGLSVSDRLSAYVVSEEVEYASVITTLDGVEHPSGGTVRQVLTFSLFPGTGEQDEALYEALRDLIVPVTYMHRDKEYTKKMRPVSNLASKFLLTSVDGKRRYKGGEIQLRRL